MSRLLAFLLMVAPLACIDATVPVDPGDTADILFEVKKGRSAKGLANALKDKDLIDATWKWKWYARSNGGCLKAGKFNLRRSMGMDEIMQTLCGTPLSEEVPLTIPEGFRIKDTDRLLAEKGWIKPGEYTRLAEGKKVAAPFEVTAKTYEGFLYPETYMVTPGKDAFSAEKLIQRQLELFNERFLKPFGKSLGKRTLEEVVIMASMVEREEPKDKNRPMVAGILWKRIDNGWQLGVDATSRYSLEYWNDERAFRQKLKDPSDPYSTRIHKGLPPTAIGAPSQSSLEAAVNPKESPYWYYLHDAQGTFHGGVDANHHERNRAKHNVY